MWLMLFTPYLLNRDSMYNLLLSHCGCGYTIRKSASPPFSVVSLCCCPSKRRGPSGHPVVVGVRRVVCVGAEMIDHANLVQYGHGMLVAIRGLEALLFLSCLHCSVAVILLFCTTANGCSPLESFHSILLWWVVTDVEGFHWSFESVFEVLLLASRGAFAMLKFAK